MLLIVKLIYIFFDKIVWAQQLVHRQLHKRDFSYSEWDINGSVDVVQDLHDKKLKAIERSLFDRNMIDYISDIKTIDFKSLHEKEFSDELWTLQWYEVLTPFKLYINVFLKTVWLVSSVIIVKYDLNVAFCIHALQIIFSMKVCFSVLIIS